LADLGCTGILTAYARLPTLYQSPAHDDQLEALLASTCEEAAVQSASSSWVPVPNAKNPTSAKWLCVTDQLALTVIQGVLEAPDSWRCKALFKLRGDASRWTQRIDKLWSLLSGPARKQISQDTLAEVYAVVAANAHADAGGRAGVFDLASYAEHCCTPSAFKELVSIELEGEPATRLVVRAHCDLNEGDTLSLSYIPEYLPTRRRREILKAGYGFDCMCPRCTQLPETVCAFRCPSCDDGP